MTDLEFFFFNSGMQQYNISYIKKKDNFIILIILIHIKINIWNAIY